jgi:glyoxylase-like metal-dependent hydrolase (beta-lactamase superfamily II)
VIFRQLFDVISSTGTYLLAERRGGEALLTDPVLEHTGRNVRLVEELDLRRVLAVYAHIHAGHSTALGALHARTGCTTAMGEMTRPEGVAVHFRNCEKLAVDGLRLGIFYTPGYADDSCSSLLPDRASTGDTLLIRRTGRTDFRNGRPAAQYDSQFGKLLRLPEDTLVYAVHGYNGMTVSTIGEERHHNPRLQVTGKQAYVDLMNAFDLDDARVMDLAVPTNRACGVLNAA